jgi:hypothetical protein
MVTFKVSDVVSFKKCQPTMDLWNSIVFQTDHNLEACGYNTTLPFIKPFEHGPLNGFIGAVHAAFDNHYPLELSPDDIWACIAQGFALHINNDPEKYRAQFVKHNGKIELRNFNTYTKGSKDNDWPLSFTFFSNEIEKHIGNKRDLIVSEFSTTGPVERVVSEIILMESMKNYFDYVEETRCGIPEITLTGTVDDWKLIKTKALVLSEFDLKWWTDKLIPVLDKFIDAAQGIVDRTFWESFYHWKSGSGGAVINGYINMLFPYFKGASYMEGYKKNGFGIRNQFIVNGYRGVLPTDFPIGISVVPFVWDYYGKIYNMEFLGGFMGTTQNSESLVIKPALGWAVRDK